MMAARSAARSRVARIGTVSGCLLAWGLAGCRAGDPVGALRAVSLGTDPVSFGGAFQTVVYAHDPLGDTSFLLSDVPVESLLDGTVRDGQVMHIELLWNPKPGATPMDASATNASIRHVVISRGEVGIYGGAGFALPHGAPGQRRLEISMRDATVRLLESTDGFVDPLSPARVTGTFTASLDPVETRRMHRAISQLVTNAIGRARYVDGARRSEAEAVAGAR